MIDASTSNSSVPMITLGSSPPGAPTGFGRLVKNSKLTAPIPLHEHMKKDKAKRRDHKHGGNRT